MTDIIPDSLRDLLERPLIAHLATPARRRFLSGQPDVVQLGRRYEALFGTNPPTDAPDRVIFVVRPTAMGKR